MCSTGSGFKLNLFYSFAGLMSSRYLLFYRQLPLSPEEVMAFLEKKPEKRTLYWALAAIEAWPGKCRQGGGVPIWKLLYIASDALRLRRYETQLSLRYYFLSPILGNFQHFWPAEQGFSYE